MKDPPLAEIPVRFYRTPSGSEPVLDWLWAMLREDRQVVGIDLMRVQVQWPIGMPLIRSRRDGLWEVRSQLQNPRISRLTSCFHEGQIVVLHGFMKKTQKTSDDDLDLARKRRREVTG